MSTTSPPSCLVWFLLLDSATGLPYKGTTADKVSVSSPADVADFRDAVKADRSNKLSSFDAADLLVYKNKSVFDKRNAAVDEGKEEPLEADSFIIGLGASMKEALVVGVPSSRSSSRKSTSESRSSLTGKELTDTLQSLQDTGKDGDAPLVVKRYTDVFHLRLVQLDQEIKALETSDEYEILAEKNRPWAVTKPTEQEKGEWQLLQEKLDELKGKRQDNVKIILSINSHSVKKSDKIRKGYKKDTAIKDERLLLSSIARKVWEKFQFHCEIDNSPTFRDLKMASGFKDDDDVRYYFRNKVKEDKIKESLTEKEWIWLIALNYRLNVLWQDTLMENEDGSLRLVLEPEVYKDGAELAKRLILKWYGPETKVDVQCCK